MWVESGKGGRWGSRGMGAIGSKIITPHGEQKEDQIKKHLDWLSVRLKSSRCLSLRGTQQEEGAEPCSQQAAWPLCPTPQSSQEVRHARSCPGPEFPSDFLYMAEAACSRIRLGSNPLGLPEAKPQPCPQHRSPLEPSL